MSKHEKKPIVGATAWHKGGLDPRPVEEVSEDGKRIRLRIFSLVTDWLPAKNYTYVYPPQPGAEQEQDR